MVKHTETNCLSVFDHFVEFTLKGLTMRNLAEQQNFFRTQHRLADMYRADQYSGMRFSYTGRHSQTEALKLPQSKKE